MEDINIYDKITSEEELINTTCNENYEDDTEFVILNKYTTVDDNMVVGEEVEVNENMDLHQSSSLDSNCSLENISTSADDNIHTCNKELTDCMETCSMISSTSSNIKDNLNQINDEESTMLSDMIKDGTIDYYNSTDDESQGDDETVAMFVTAAGQQLALYAVEDNDDIFAVSLYDESGEPPTNFQFLMKVDVERLIGEGAVNVVKKPSQIKKHLLTPQSSVLLPKECLMNQEEDDFGKDMVQDNDQIKEHETTWIKKSPKKYDTKHELVVDDNNKSEDSNVTYLMVDDCNMMLDTSPVNEDIQSDEEILEQSTVQYIFFEDNESDSELTFGEVLSTLQNMKHDRLSKKSYMRTEIDDESNKLEESSSKMILSNGIESNEDRLNTSKDTEICNESNPINTVYKAKRPRKQQLTSVNREDSEIIIQPASLLAEIEKSTKSRGRRRRFNSPSEYHGKRNNSKSLMRMKQRVIEIINIDLDEDEKMSSEEKNIVEITIDENKDKYSSDKENDIIMVGDSDDDDEVKENVSKHTGTLMQCEFCSRRFRQKRALDTHSRVCSKSSSDVGKFDHETIDHVNNVDKKKDTKLYSCKICQEKFEVVVALARHVRLEHSQRKRRISSKSSGEPDSDESYSMEVTKENVRIHKRTKKKRDHVHSWETKKLCCKDCGRWFSSAASLSTHYLKHDTKRPEKQIRRCEICKKLIKSRMLFIRHLKMHNNLKLYAGMSALQKKLRSTRQPTRKIMALRKRGRPRKL
ncbi:PREDICTED: myoneurin-like [Polistes dominula]|uniref:Myoneurin-like n=1 Tax=Polistes dominula TaxID=743375 RepID=A0ABM1J4U2_POLDO|nr:PREDICTED: myoneurin-like [Polistes dominula]